MRKNKENAFQMFRHIILNIAGRDILLIERKQKKTLLYFNHILYESF